MAKKNFEPPLSRFGVLVAQLESIVASASQQPPDPLLCFDLLSDLISAIVDEPKDCILVCQRKCEDALYSLLVLGARRPVRHLASIAMAKIIAKGDPISIYSRASSLQGFLSDGKRSDAQRVTGAAQCLGELYRLFGRKITSGFPETASIASKLMKYHEEYVRKEALYMLQHAMEGCGGTAVTTAYTEAFRLIMRFGVVDKSSIVRIAAARCLKALANIGGPGLGPSELENSASTCVKAFNDSLSSVRDAFADALGSVLALVMTPEAQVQPRGKGQPVSGKKLEGCLQRHLVSPFVKASGVRPRDVRISVTLAWVSFLQAILLKYQRPDSELQDFATQVMDMLQVDTSVDAHALACVLYILRVGVVDQLTEPTQRSFLVVLGQQLQSPDSSSLMKVAALRTLSYTLKTLGEVPVEFKEVLDNTVVAALSHPSQMVRVEAALMLRALAEVDPTCVSGLVSYGVTTLNALRESVSFDKGHISKLDLDSMHGQATLLAALVSVSPKLPLGYPARLPHSVLEVCKKMLTKPSRNLEAATVEKEAGWVLLASLLASVPKEEFEDQVFDVLALWAPLFSGNPELEVPKSGDWTPQISVWSAAVDALTAFVRCFVSSQFMNSGILLQPVLVYLSSALSRISFVAAKNLPSAKSALDVFIIRTLIAFQSLSDPLAYRSDHSKLLQICSAPYREPSAYEESSCLRLLLDKRDAWLGPWTPGRDWFEDELRAFQGGKDGLMPCIWDSKLHSFPQPETVNKMLINQKLLCFGIVFAFQDNGTMLSLLGVIEQSLKAGKKQSWHANNINNICVGLLAGLKAMLIFRPQQLGSEILNLMQNIFQNILAEGDISSSLRRASCEGLGLLTRLGSDNFTARMTKTLLTDLAGTTDANLAGSVSVALGCIHHSAGGMALSSLVPATVSAISALAKSTVAGLQIWALHGLLLTIEAAGLSYVSHVQATLNLGLEILLSEENGWVDLQQGVGRLINAIVAVLGPELAPGSNFFSRCKSVIAEISSCEETATLLENIRFTQQLVLFAPQALSVHVHVKTLLPTLSSRQPTLRHLAITTLRHLIEKDSVSIIHEQIEETLFYMLDEETDAEIGSLVRSTIMRLLYASCPSRPSHWISVCRKLVLATTSRESVTNSNREKDLTNDSEGGASLDLGEDDENMVSSSESMSKQGYSWDAYGAVVKRERHLRYKTRVFAAECLSSLPTAVGMNPLHFDLLLARKQEKRPSSGDWLVLQLQELVSLAYQISIIQFETMQPIGVELLSTIMDKFGEVPDPELPGCLLLEQYQAQLVSALRSALDMSSGPVLLEAGLQLATKILISGIIRGDQAAVKRIFSLISVPLSDFEGLYYPSFAEWVSCKIKVRLLAAHASLKCYTYTFLREHHSEVPDEYMALLPLFSKNSGMLGKRWIGVLKDYCFISLNVHLKKNWTPFLEGIKSPTVSSKLKICLEEVWPILLQAVALDAAPLTVDVDLDKSCYATEENLPNDLLSGFSMVELHFEEFQFLWGFSLLILFQGQNITLEQQIIPLPVKAKDGGDSPIDETKLQSLKLYEVVLPVFRSLSSEKFFRAGFLTVDICRELLQVFSCIGSQGDSWNSLAVTVLAQIVRNCPDSFLKISSFASLLMELCLGYLYKNFSRNDVVLTDDSGMEILTSQLFATAKTLLNRLESETQLKLILAFMLAGYHCARRASTEASFSQIIGFVVHTCGLLNNLVGEKSNREIVTAHHLQMIIGAGQNAVSNLAKDCIEAICLLENKMSNLRRLVFAKLTFCLEQMLFFADLLFKMELSPEEGCSTNATFSCGCIRSFSFVLMHANMKVQAIGLQVLKNTIQKKLNSSGRSFLLFLSGELFGDILIVIKKIVTEPVTKESAAFAGECLKTLVLMQTLSKEIECQRGLISLLLEAVIMVLSGTEGNMSEGQNDLRSIVIRLVSQVVQVPSVAIHLKDVLLEMSDEDRKQIQNIIRASVTQEHQSTPVKPSGGSLQIKLPNQSLQIKDPNSATTLPNEPSEDLENEDENEDDWDAFQSFPTVTNTNATDTPSNAEKSSTNESHSEEEDDFQEFSSFVTSTDAKENSQPYQNPEKEEPTLESSPKNAEYESSERPSEASQSRDSMEISGDVDEVNIMTEKSTSSDNPSELATVQSSEDQEASLLEVNDVFDGNRPLESSIDIMTEKSTSNDNPIDLTTVQSSEEQEASLLEVNDVFDGNRPLESSVDSVQNLSSENKDIASPENVSECLELTVSQDNIVTVENSESQTSVENLNIALDQGFIDSSEKIEDQDMATKPETSQNRQESDKRDSAECESTIQKHEFSTMSGPSETQAQAQAQADTYDSIVKPEEKDKDFKSTPSEVNEDAIAKTEVELLDSSEYDGATKSLEKPRDSTEDNTLEAK
ncbi:protein SWEETIE [Silene latifolia]|uniref:protein SWEETIE n=1 Tax=Silene latifolia TaxID=37657 RepID=UPI003D7710AA